MIRWIVSSPFFSHGGSAMSDALKHAPGNFCWIEVGTTDATGATFAVWQAKEHGGAQVANEPGTVCWNELATRDRGAAAKFIGRFAVIQDPTGATFSVIKLEQPA
jgi:predicted enzyme related to lactoylglutathione lyase